MIFSNVVGIDGGINFIAATYDSKRKSTFVNGRAIKQKRAHYKKLRQQLQKVQTPSSRRRLKAIGNRENRWMHDVNHTENLLDEISAVAYDKAVAVVSENAVNDALKASTEQVDK